jgi:hypothetical protein
MNIFERKHRTNNNKQIIILFDVDFISDGQLLQLFECITQTKSNSSNCNSKKNQKQFLSRLKIDLEIFGGKKYF